MREGAPGTRISWSSEEKVCIAGKRHRSQGISASHKQGRLVAGVCCAGSIQNASRVAPPQYCSSRMVRHRAAPLMRAAVVGPPLGSTTRHSPPYVSRHGTTRYFGCARQRSPYHTFTRAALAQTYSAHTEASSHRAACETARPPPADSLVLPRSDRTQIPQPPSICR